MILLLARPLSAALPLTILEISLERPTSSDTAHERTWYHVINARTHIINTTVSSSSIK
jgi:hypothetical protein